jgi:hypothetical protein
VRIERKEIESHQHSLARRMGNQVSRAWTLDHWNCPQEGTESLAAELRGIRGEVFSVSIGNFSANNDEGPLYPHPPFERPPYSCRFPRDQNDPRHVFGKSFCRHDFK